MSNDITKIALTGKLRSGKSSISSHLLYAHNFDRIGFGDALKRYSDELFKDSKVYPMEYVEIGTPCPFDGKRTKYAKKPRKLLQDFGQAMRELDSDVWIRQASIMVDYYVNQRDTVGIVIDDLRQPNEYEWARANGFTIIRVNADEELRADRANVLGDDYREEDMRHDTEQHVDNFAVDYEINNNGDKEALRRKIDEILSEINPTP